MKSTNLRTTGPGDLPVHLIQAPKEQQVRNFIFYGKKYEFCISGHEELVTGILLDAVCHVANIAYAGDLGLTQIPVYYVVQAEEDGEHHRFILASQVIWFRCLEVVLNG